MGDVRDTPPIPATRPDGRTYDDKWRAFSAIGLALVTSVMAMSMVFVALPAIADEFSITLRSVAWVVIVQSLTVSSLMLPMGRLADLVGRRRMHLIGFTTFGIGALGVALAPTFSLLLVARVVMSLGNTMGQSVGTAMIVAVFPEHERGKAIGSQTTAVAIGSASGPIIGGLILQVLPWEAMFLLILIPVTIALVAAYVILDEDLVGSSDPTTVARFDWLGAGFSALGVIIAVLVINNPLSLPWLSPLPILGALAAIVLFAVWVRWERRTPSPMLDLSLFASRIFSSSVVARWLGFTATTTVFFMAPVFLISFRSLTPARAGAVLFLNSVGLGLAAQLSGRLSDRFGPRPFIAIGFVLFTASAIGLSLLTRSTPIPWILPPMFGAGLAMGMWNVPNNSTIMGSAPSSHHGVVGALTNLIRNLGNVTGQALASTVVVGIMTARGFDIPLSEIADSVLAGDAFLAGWQWIFRVAAGLSVVALIVTLTGARSTLPQR